MEMLKPGDIVLYTWTEHPEGHGSVAVIRKVRYNYCGRTVTDIDWITCGSALLRGLTLEDWYPACWEKIGHIELPSEQLGADDASA
jgi:hypothetical protein